MGGRVNCELALTGIHSVHRGHHHLHVLLLLEVVSMVILVALVLVVVHRHLVHVVLEHHLLGVLLEEGVGRLRQVSGVASTRHHVAASTALVISASAVAMASLMVVLVTRYRT